MSDPRRQLSAARIPSIGRRIAFALGVVTIGSLVGTVVARGGGGQNRIPTTPNDFFQPGTQPEPDTAVFDPLVGAINCTYCHSGYGDEVAPFDTWIASVMGQSARDPIWHAALAIANQDVETGGETCIRCHAPAAWLGGRSGTGTAAEFTYEDYDGINCNFCHRVVNPELGPESAVGYPDEPAEPDVPIISALAKEGLIPTGAGNARYVVDPRDSRRGPFSDVPMNLHGQGPTGEMARLITSPYHRASEFCGTCHDVSNPLYSKTKKGHYALNAYDSPHPTQDPMDMYPEQRTYSEWLHSDYPNGVAYADRRFGGNDPDGVVSSCQDCHMPKVVAGGCRFYEFGEPWFERQDMPQHSFAGGNTWIVQAVRNMLGDEEADAIGLDQQLIDQAAARTVEMLRNASDMTVTREGSSIRVRVVNESGHKLPTGYPEGRRMWLNVRFLNAQGKTIAERGAYDSATATLVAGNTKVYEAKHGIDAAVAKATGLPAGPGFHLALANRIFKDNRIPPRGFTNEAYRAIGAAPVGATYADGQHWDDTSFAIPKGAASATVTLYFQTTSREYVEFLRDANVTNDAGQRAYDLWVETGKSAPVAMDSATIELPAGNPADLDGNGAVDAADLAILLANWGNPGIGDFDQSGLVDAADLSFMLANWN